MAFKRIGFGQVEPNQLSGIKTGQIYASLPLDPTVEILQNGEFMYYDYGKSLVTGVPSVEGMEPYLVFQEIKIYEDWLSYKDFAMIRVGDNYVTNIGAIGRLTSVNTNGVTYGDGSLNKGAYFADKKDDSITDRVYAGPEHNNYQAGYRMDGIAPRLVKTNIGDIYTTNMLIPVEDESVYAKGKSLQLVPVENTASNGSKYTTLVLAPKGTAKALDTMEFIVAKYYTMPDGQPGVKVQRIK